MPTLYSERVELCSQCHAKSRHSFCDLPEKVFSDLEAIVQPFSYSQGTRLFLEGQMPRGVFILCQGRVKLFSSSSNGKALMRIAGVGEILGLSAIIMGNTHETTAESLESGQVQFIRKDLFLHFVQKHGEASLRATQILSRDYYNVYEQAKSLILSDCAEQKLANLLLRWCRENGQISGNGIQVKVTLTHGEIAQMIGVARETVTRLFSELKNRQVIRLEGSNLFVHNPSELEDIINL